MPSTQSQIDLHDGTYDGMLSNWLRASKYKVLHILHNRPNTSRRKNLPGGTEYHVGDLIRMIPAAAHWSLFSTGSEYCLTAHIPGREIEYYIPAEDMDLSSFVHTDLFDVIHVHHTDKIDYENLADSLVRHGRYFISLHDFRLCCPRINLLTPQGRLCNGHECVSACHLKQSKIESLRATTKRVFENARAVIHFCDSTKAWFTRIIGGEYRWKILDHGIQLLKPDNKQDAVKLVYPKPSSTVPLKVAFLGHIASHKGANLIRRVLKSRSLPSGIPIQWHLIGSIDGSVDPKVIRHGRYERDELYDILESVSPHLVAILSITPESYCYTFDEALICGIPVISTPLGAPAERLRSYRCGWIVENLDVGGILKTLQRVADDWDEYQAVRRRIANIPIKSAQDMAENYDELYHTACQSGEKSDPLRLLQIVNRLPTSSDARLSWPRLMAGHFVNACLNAIDAINARSMIRGMAKRVLPDSVIRKIHDLRQLVS
jgi:glycosyltransferase involved in cell wall biosynthesis